MIIAFTFAFLTGAFSVLLLQAFLLYKWWTTKEREAPKLVVERNKVTNPKLVAEYLKNEAATEKESCMFLNLLVSFLWREWRDTTATNNFFLRRLNMEFTDLVHSKTAGRVIEQITIQDFSLGNSLPVVKGATIMKVGSKDPEEVPQVLDVCFDLEYSGGCHVAIQVDLLFNKSAYFSVKMVYLKGRGRLQFSRQPCTHWSFSFYEEPEVEFEAESQFEGKTIPQLTSLIVNHLRRSIYKKHTLPSYKIRYIPFFTQLHPQDDRQDIYIHDSLLTVGQLAVELVGCSRLPDVEGSVSLYCSLSVDVLPWKQLAENSRALWTTYEVELTRENTAASFGMTLCKEYGGTDIDKFIMVDTIIPQSPADIAGLHQGDVLVSVDGQRIESLKQAAKLIKNKVKFSANFQRPPSKMSSKAEGHDGMDGTTVNFKNVALDSGESDSEEEFVNIMMPLIEKHSDGEVTKTAVREFLTKSTELRQRSGKSPKGQPFKRSATLGSDLRRTSKESAESLRSRRAMTVSTDGKSSERPRSISPEARESVSKSSEGSSPKDEEVKMSLVIKPSTYTERPGTKKTREVQASQEPAWNETIMFDVEKKDKYLNVCVWRKSHEKTEKDLLIGYITVPLMDVIVQCLTVGVGRHQQTFILVSPHIDRIIPSMPGLRTHPGLREDLCGGDVTLTFHHTPSFTDCADSVLEKEEELTKIRAQEVESESEDSYESSEQVEHHFVLTQFYFPTRCHYCSKKVWTKVAFQCRNCALICHKKCLESCKRFSSCLRTTNARSRWFTKKPAQPPGDVETTPDEQPSTANQSPASTDETAESSEEHTTDDLSPQQNGDASIIHGETGTETAGDNETWHSPDKGEEESRPSDMETASQQVKEIGRELFFNLPLDARKKKLQEMMARLQVEIDEENETRTEVYQSKKDAKDKKLRSYLKSLIAKSEERSQALAMLMLQYCAGLQSCADAEEEETCHL